MENSNHQGIWVNRVKRIADQKWPAALLFTGLLLLLLFCCKKEAQKTLPTVITATVTNLTATSATSGGEITSASGTEITARGICWSTTQSPTTTSDKTTDGIGVGIFTSSINGLTPNTTYYVRAYAINSAGTAYGNQITLRTSTTVPTISTTEISNITTITAISGGNITNDGGFQVITRGVCWRTNITPDITDNKTNDGTGSGIFTSSITGLCPNTTYYIRAYAINSIGTAYGNQLIFTTSDYPNCGTVTDVDGNVYKTVTIGTQCWLRENLKTTKYRNGDPIPNVTNDAAWAALTTGAYCWYNNDATTYKATYGALYNWFTVSDSRNIAPTGWHVATDAEWTTLTSYLGGITVAGTKLKEKNSFPDPDISHWFTGGYDTVVATNETGFTAVGGGDRFINGSFMDMNFYGYWITSTCQLRSMAYNDGNVGGGGGGVGYKNSGYSVRCVKD